MRCFGVFCIISDINPLSELRFVNIFSHSAGYLFILLMVFLAEQKLLSLMQSHLFISNLVAYALDVQSIIPKTYIRVFFFFFLCFLLVVSLFQVLRLSLQSIQINFSEWYKQGPSVILLYMSCFRTLILERTKKLFLYD